ncbi:MAG: FAD-dependent oxidoreductase [Methylobacteriaceae bacterium]|nr:FAD-dependent oxidoreductase [Methylobacteriaceae bacterium]
MARDAEGAVSARPTRRAALAGLAAATLARPALAQARAKAVVVGGGFGGASAARALAAAAIDVTLVEPTPAYVACPLSNAVIGGFRDLSAQRFGYGGLERAGVRRAPLAASGVDGAARIVTLSDGTRLPYDRLLLAPGIDFAFDALPGYDAAAAERLPHAWKAGPQTELLSRQIDAMPEGGVVVMSVPANPYRCPPGPYERASLIAYRLKRTKPRAKLIILDGKDVFSKQRLFLQAWAELYPGLIEWVGLSKGGKVTRVEAETSTLATEFGRHRADVANVIPPQRAAAIAQIAGVADRSGWCPVDPVSFESKLVPGAHVIGDAAIMGGMPKSAFAANGQAKVAAAAIAALLRGEPAPPAKLINVCYSLVSPDYGVSIGGVYRARGEVLADVEGAGGVSPLEAPPATRRREAELAQTWFDTVTHDVFG